MLAIFTINKPDSLQRQGGYIDLQQRGIALPLTLILLFVMTLIAVATLRTATLEESMSANSRLRQVAVNAAETALTEAERVVLSLDPWERRGRFFATGFVGPEPGVANKGDSCRLGFCTPRKFTNLLDPTFVIPDEERWEDPDI